MPDALTTENHGLRERIEERVSFLRARSCDAFGETDVARAIELMIKSVIANDFSPKDESTSDGWTPTLEMCEAAQINLRQILVEKGIL